MAVPKREMSHSNTHNHRLQWKTKLAELNTARIQGREIPVPHRLTRAYKGGLIEQ